MELRTIQPFTRATSVQSWEISNSSPVFDSQPCIHLHLQTPNEKAFASADPDPPLQLTHRTHRTHLPPPGRRAARGAPLPIDRSVLDRFERPSPTAGGRIRFVDRTDRMDGHVGSGAT